MDPKLDDQCFVCYHALQNCPILPEQDIFTNPDTRWQARIGPQSQNIDGTG